ncbi:MAG: DUF6119 family protein [Actinomycetota bacterium]|nr:DUF6119 family protein [Actinomycetota bacterium]
MLTDVADVGVDEHQGYRLPLNVFLLREAYELPTDAVSEPSLEYMRAYVPAGDVDGRQWEHEPDLNLLGASQAGDLVLVVFERPTNAAPWLPFIRNEFGLTGQFGRGGGRSLGAIIFCAQLDPRHGRLRWFGWTFGTGSRALRRTATDTRFGLIAALSGITPEDEGLEGPADEVDKPWRPQLRQLQHRASSPYQRASGHRAARDIPVEGFPFDRFADLVSSAGGKTRAAWAPSVIGGRSFRFTNVIDRPSDLIERSDLIFDWFRSDRYKAAYGWIDNFTLIEDEELIGELRTVVADKFAAEPDQRDLDVLLPDDLIDVDDERAIEFVRFPRGVAGSSTRKNSSNITLTRAMVERLFRGGAGSSDPFDVEMEFLDVERAPLGTSTVLECLFGEVRRGSDTFILHDGDFYRVEASYLEKLRCQIAGIDEATIELAPYEGGSEGKYNEAAAEAGRLLCLDRRLVKVPGETTFEACDLLHPDGYVIHVKRKGRSSVLSHLFAQAYVSAEALRESDESMKEFRRIVEQSEADRDLISRSLDSLEAFDARTRDLEVVFVFIGEWRGRTLQNLPLFSRIALANAVKQIERLGYRVSYKCVDQITVV